MCDTVTVTLGFALLRQEHYTGFTHCSKLHRAERGTYAQVAQAQRHAVWRERIYKSTRAPQPQQERQCHRQARACAPTAAGSKYHGMNAFEHQIENTRDVLLAAATQRGLRWCVKTQRWRTSAKNDELVGRFLCALLFVWLPPAGTHPCACSGKVKNTIAGKCCNSHGDPTSRCVPVRRSRRTRARLPQSEP